MKYGVTREEAEWVKVHVMTGVKTNVVTANEPKPTHLLKFSGVYLCKAK